MTVPVAALSRTKAAAPILFLGGGSLWILSRPFWEDGGLNALVAGPVDGRGWWPVLAVCAVILLPMMARAAFRLIRHRGPALLIESGRLHGYGWKKPLDLATIALVSSSRTNWLAGRLGGVAVHLADGSKKHVTPYLDADTETVAAKLSDALSRAGWTPSEVNPPLS